MNIRNVNGKPEDYLSFLGSRGYQRGKVYNAEMHLNPHFSYGDICGDLILVSRPGWEREDGGVTVFCIWLSHLSDDTPPENVQNMRHTTM